MNTKPVAQQVMGFVVEKMIFRTPVFITREAVRKNADRSDRMNVMLGLRVKHHRAADKRHLCRFHEVHKLKLDENVLVPAELAPCRNA